MNGPSENQRSVHFPIQAFSKCECVSGYLPGFLSTRKRSKHLLHLRRGKDGQTWMSTVTQGVKIPSANSFFLSNLSFSISLSFGVPLSTLSSKERLHIVQIVLCRLTTLIFVIVFNLIRNAWDICYMLTFCSCILRDVSQTNKRIPITISQYCKGQAC